jgi:hypothetical protein
MQGSFRIDMCSPKAAAMLDQLFRSLQRNGLPSILPKLPFSLMPKLAAMASLATAAGSLSASLGINVASPHAGAQLSAALAASAAASASASASAAAAASAAISAQAAFAASALGSAMASVQAGMGINLAAPGGCAALSNALGWLAHNIASAPPIGSLMGAPLLAQSAALLTALGAISAGLKVNLAAPGAWKAVNATFGKMLSANGVCAVAGSWAASKTAMGSLSLGAHAMAHASAQASAMAMAGLPAAMSNIPSVPELLGALALLVAAAAAYPGVNLIQFGSCGSPCLFNALALICPKAML